MSEAIVELSEGKIRGVTGESLDGKTIYKFLGIPYAKSPIGELRFKAPLPAEPWEGIKDATKDGDASYHRDLLMENPELVGSEDCLVLNVYTRNIEPTENLKPVMAFIHGGGFTMGSNKSDIFGPELLLMEDIVLVAMNYRLGLMGFLSLEDKSLDVPGNAGLKDQTLSLKWIQKNINRFGGDPNNVTIFGESAGSGSVHFHILSPSSKGLFHKAILQSGVALSPWALGSSNGSIIAEALGKKEATDQDVYSILKDMDYKEIYTLQEKIPDPLLFGTQRPFVPVVEKENPTAFITRTPIDLMINGEYNHVPVLIGYNSHEGILFEFLKKVVPDIHDMYTYPLAVPWFMNATEEQNKKIVDLLSNFYSKIKASENKDTLMMDSIFLSEIAAFITNYTKTSKQPIYVYRVSIDGKRNWVKQAQGLQEFEGTAHGDELGYLFGIQELPKIEENTPEHLAVQRFVKFWTNFAKFGNLTPNDDFGVNLAPVKDGNKITALDIGEDLTVLEDLPERNRIELWKSIFNLCEKTSNYL